MSRRKKRFAQNPMLYITQPNLKEPKASMQSDYRTPRKKKDKLKPDTSEENKKSMKIRTPKPLAGEKEVEYGNQDDVIEAIEDNHEQQNKNKKHEKEAGEDKSIHPRTSRKRFKDMTNEEKVEYFVGLPSQIPKMKCEVTTETERHRGVIIDYKDGQVKMVTFKSPRNREIPLDEIVHIRLLSF
ncbi:spore coat CotO family protein [Aquibacillus koreensis]|uniref:Spore coat CotO family protein n=1 Tax=Aquibacillus koreensis TaxID=279446 RepID=A0A9X3WMI1_9BACI|nr:spore coat CotO family protein [Aquibacillus koreensis]MCT2535671.1 spore coat CotO family protein [Aquibacillus koreensis]MDC3420044.1 spore coat CotO family protein [Aquibacillus koreensis]